MFDERTVTPQEQARALWLSTIAFTVCFAVWTIFAIIGVRIKDELGLNETQFGLLVGTPILTGSLIRLALGIWTDQYGGRLVYTLTMLAAAVATFLLSYATTYPQSLSWWPTAGRQPRRSGPSASPSWESCFGSPQPTTRYSASAVRAAKNQPAPGSNWSR
jgi:MFS family permease